MIKRLSVEQIKELKNIGIVRLILKNEQGESICKVYPNEFEELAKSAEGGNLEVFIDTKDVFNKDKFK